MRGVTHLIKDCALVCLLKRGPEDMPYSATSLLGMTVILMAAIWGISVAIQVPDNQLLTIETFDLLVSFGFVAVVLRQAQKLNRYVQSMMALIGTEALLNLALLSMLLLVGQSSGGIILVAFSTACYFWRLVVLCHIFRAMLSTDLPVALLTTMTFEGVRIIMMLLFLPLLGSN